MAVALGFHIVFAALAIGVPLLLAVHRVPRDPQGRRACGWRITRRWCAGARHPRRGRCGVRHRPVVRPRTVLARADGSWGSVIGLPFALEAFAFFIEAIFIGIYLFGWDRVSPWRHWLSGWPVVLGGAASAWFIITANSWMQSPVGFELSAGGKVVDVQPIRAMLNPSTPMMTTHMILAALHGDRAHDRVGVRGRDAEGAPRHLSPSRAGASG